MRYLYLVELIKPGNVLIAMEKSELFRFTSIHVAGGKILVHIGEQIEEACELISNYHLNEIAISY
jgi:hypothetical protein